MMKSWKWLSNTVITRHAAITTATDTLTADLPQRVEGQEPQADAVMTNHLIGT